jgi:hypothetical protein
MGKIVELDFYWKDKNKKIIEIKCPYCNYKMLFNINIGSITKCICGKKFKLREINESCTLNQSRCS